MGSRCVTISSEPKRPSGECKDCWTERRAGRPAPYPGPRCATHHREEQRRRKHEAQMRRDAQVYGLAAGGYEALLEIQGGTCAICRRATGRTKRLAVDHDHGSGAVRGLLCGPDNQLIGRAGDAPEFFERGETYLRTPPALWLPPEFIIERN